MSAYSAAGWDGFGTTAATAAATLTGLLFIAVSINLKQILTETALPGRTAQTLIFFVLPLIAALLLVVPGQARTALGDELIGTGVFAGATGLIVDHRAGASREEPPWSRPVLRTIPHVACAAGLIGSGASLVAQAGGGLYWLVPVTFVAVLAGLINTWVLLIEILR